jgi:phosphoglycolate phosphatase-like HAD superfamily hydrolase
MKREEFKREFFLPYTDFFKSRELYAEKTELNEIYYPEYNKMPEPSVFKGAKTALKKLREKGIILTIISAQRSPELKLEIGRNGLRKLFDVVGGDAVDKRAWISKFVKELGVEKNKVMMVGDMVHDIEAGKTAGIRTTAVLWGYNSLEKLTEAKPDFVVKNFNELIALVD